LSNVTERQHGVNVCSACASPFLQPIDWQRLDFFTWKITVSCPNCHRTSESVMTEDEVRELYNSVQEGLRSLKGALEELEKVSFQSECQAIILALRSDSVYPMDF
jgi:hypothetical protein